MYNLAHIVLLVLVHMLQMGPSYEAPAAAATTEEDASYNIERGPLADEMKVTVTVTCTGDCDKSVAIQATKSEEGGAVGEIVVDEENYQDGGAPQREVCPKPGDSNRKYIFTSGTPIDKIYLKWKNDESELPAELHLMAGEAEICQEDEDTSSSENSSQSNSESSEESRK